MTKIVASTTTKTMISNTQVFDTNAYPHIKEQILHWVNQFSICSFLDNHQYHQPTAGIECLAAAGAVRIFNTHLNAIDAHIQEQKTWLFGHLNYEWKATTPDPIGFAPFCFFEPETVLYLQHTQLIIESTTLAPSKIFEAIIEIPVSAQITTQQITIKQTVNKAEYINIINQIQTHIQRGDCYELNYCIEFLADNISCNGLQLYKSLSEISPVPFACFYKQENAALICASPERYLKKTGDQLLTQPIKGTIQRNLTDATADNILKATLQKSEKDKSENVMVVDMVRNDLSRVCKEGSVKVDELFGIYSYPQVHQMISSITGTIKDHIPFSEIIEATYPMGSMTGAPKNRVMQLIKQYEQSPRGLFSGAVGYINPGGDFDFNVVIRSLFYNSQTKKLRYLAGSGITIYSNAATEYDECLLKAKALAKVLGN
jgi:para-aminobenzoate synthetase component I